MSWLSDLFKPKSKTVATPTIAPEQQKLLGDLAKRLGAGGFSWMETSPEDIVKRWESYIADPVMSAWEQTAKPLAMRKYNLPGSFYSADASRGMLRESEQFLQTSLLPSLYSSQENMFNRLYGLAGGLATGSTMNIDTLAYPSTFQNLSNLGMSAAALALMV